MKMKQTFALLCAGAMVITGSAFPVNVQASADWVWNEEVSESGYKKVPYTELTTTADTEADNESRLIIIRVIAEIISRTGKTAL